MKDSKSPLVVHVDLLTKGTLTLMGKPMLLVTLNQDAYANVCRKRGVTPETVEHEEWAEILKLMAWRLAEDYLRPDTVTLVANLQYALAGDGHARQSQKPDYVGEFGEVVWLADEMKPVK